MFRFLLVCFLVGLNTRTLADSALSHLINTHFYSKNSARDSTAGVCLRRAGIQRKCPKSFTWTVAFGCDVLAGPSLHPSPGFHRMKNGAQTRTLGGPRPHDHNSTRRPRERRQTETCGGRGKKRENLGKHSPGPGPHHHHPPHLTSKKMSVSALR